MAHPGFGTRIGAAGHSIADRWRRLPVGLRLVAVAAVAITFVVSVAWQRCGVRGCPNVDRLTAYQPGGAPRLFDRNGRPFADLRPVAGAVVKLKGLPKHVPAAFVAVEDHRFYSHHGVDVIRVGGAAAANLRAGGVAEGFSTITMQLARNVFPDRLPARERNLTRKLLEVRVAREIERRFEKDEILELYLNHIYFGNGARGIEAAARHYFGRSAGDLTLPQAALLAALPKGPSRYDPRRHPEDARKRRDLVLTLMEKQERVAPDRARAARDAPLGVVRRRRAEGAGETFAPYFVEQVRRELEEQLGESLYDQPSRVVTTLDIAAQRAAEEALEAGLRATESGGRGAFGGPSYSRAVGEEGPAYLQGAVVALEAATGDVIAWVGGRDFGHSRFDRVRSARRQAGSAFKPFVYAAALSAGHTLSEPLLDTPLRVRLDGNTSWEPKNFDGTFEGRVTLREALVRSKNVPTVRLADATGLDEIAEMAHDSGVESEIPETPAMPLGTVALSPLELASAYTVFASLGRRAIPRTVLRVEGPEGDVVWEARKPEPAEVLDPPIAYLVTAALGEAVYRGTGTAAREAGYAGPAAGKTGTTNDGTDAWFVGMTPDLVAAVWIGFDDARPIMPLATGGRLAAPVWGALMRRVYDGRAMPSPWSPPEGIVQGWVDPASGLVLEKGCRPAASAAYREFFARRHQPKKVCPDRGAMVEGEIARLPPDDDEADDLALGLPAVLGGRSEPAPPADLEEIERLVKRAKKEWKGRRIDWEDVREEVEERRERDDDDDDDEKADRGKERGRDKGRGRGKRGRDRD